MGGFKPFLPQHSEVIVRAKPLVRRCLKAILMIPAFAALVALAIANHQPVTVSFNPFDSSDPDLAVTVPLYLVGFMVWDLWFSSWAWLSAASRLGSNRASAVGSVADSRLKTS